MLKNYLTIILRKLRKERLYTFVNLLGLTVGLCAVLFIGLFVNDELSFDKFHTDKDRTFRVISQSPRFGYSSHIASDYVDRVAEVTPQIESFSRIRKMGGQALLEAEGTRLYAREVLMVDHNFFEFFDFKLLDGQAANVLNEPATAVISEAMAARVFGDKNPVGERLLIDKARSVVITGVAADAPANSHIQFDLLVSEDGGFESDFEKMGYVSSVISYVKLLSDEDVSYVTEQLAYMKDKMPYTILLEGETFELMPLVEQHLTSAYENDAFAKNDLRFIYLFTGIGLVILILAVINYINLATAQALRRLKEIGLRKVIGASRSQLLMYQFMESVVVTTISFILAFALAERALPLYNSLLSKSITLNYLSPEFLVGVPVLGGIVGLLAGAYPAFFQSRFQALRLVNRQISDKGGKKNLRRGLMLLQFMVAGVLLLTTLIMQSQVRYLKEKDLGFDKDHLLSVPMYEDSVYNGAYLKQQVSSLAGVKNVSVSSWRMGGGLSSVVFSSDPDQNEDAERVRMEYILGDKDYIQTLGLKVTESSQSYREHGIRSGEVVASLKLLEVLGWQDNPIGREVYDFDSETFTIVAVVEDFHVRPLKTEIRPALIYLGNAPRSENLIVRLEAESYATVIESVGGLYEEAFQRPFEYSFVDDQMEQFYKTEFGQFKLFSILTSLAVFIALMGLLALTTYMTQQRQKEVSIRKVLGASMKELLLMLNKEHTWLTIIAFAIATPVAVYAMQDWLANFKYHIDLKPTLFITAVLGFVALNIIITLVYTLRVSRANPAETLRND